MLYIATNGGGMGTSAVSLSSLSSQQPFSMNPFSDEPSKSKTATNDANVKSSYEFSFQTVHDAFGKEIMQDLNERKRLKELAQRPLIEI